MYRGGLPAFPSDSYGKNVLGNAAACFPLHGRDLPRPRPASALGTRETLDQSDSTLENPRKTRGRVADWVVPVPRSSPLH